MEDEGVENEVSSQRPEDLDTTLAADRLLLQSFSNLWIEFLLKEAGQGAAGPGGGPAAGSPSSSGPTSPRLSENGSRLDLPTLGSPPPPSTTSTTRRPSLTSLFSSSNGGGASSAPTSSATPSIKEEGAS